jgi:hypothetical protein
MTLNSVPFDKILLRRGPYNSNKDSGTGRKESQTVYKAREDYAKKRGNDADKIKEREE